MKLQYQLSGTKSGTEKGYTLSYLSTSGIEIYVEISIMHFDAACFSYFKSLN